MIQNVIIFHFISRKSRFLKKSKQVELSYKDKSEDVPVIAKSGSQSKYENMDLDDDTQDNSFKSKLKTSKNSRGLTVVEFPHDPDDLPALPAAPPRNIPKYHGWTHSDNADSWFLEVSEMTRLVFIPKTYQR